MKCVILAGGFGTRISEETASRPKPMVEIGGYPILWHIMKIYSHFGVNDFVVCLGYKGYVIKEFFANYYLHTSDVTFDMRNGSTEIHQNKSEPWRVTLVDTGEGTMTGERVKRVREYVGDETFCMTYGDGIADIEIDKEIEFHKKMKVFATMGAVQPPGRYGHVEMHDGKITSFQEKTHGDGGWINGGFFVLEPEIFDFIEGDDSTWERTPLENLAKQNQLAAWHHRGFWRPMDTLRDKVQLEEMWQTNNAKWRVWR